MYTEPRAFTLGPAYNEYKKAFQSNANCPLSSWSRGRGVESQYGEVGEVQVNKLHISGKGSLYGEGRWFWVINTTNP